MIHGFSEYSIRIVRRELGCAGDDWHATVTRLHDGKQAIFISRFKWWLKGVLLRQWYIRWVFRGIDKSDRKAGEVEEYKV